MIRRARDVSRARPASACRRRSPAHARRRAAGAQALRELDAEGATITFAAVAKRARVSRVFLYEHADLRVEIETLRSVQETAPARLPVRQRASDASLRARLREELALAHGRVRELELDRRVRRA